MHGTEEGWVLGESSRRIPCLEALWLAVWPVIQQKFVCRPFHCGKWAAEVSRHLSQQQLPVTAACSRMPALAVWIKSAFISNQPFDLIVPIGIWDNRSAAVINQLPTTGSKSQHFHDLYIGAS